MIFYLLSINERACLLQHWVQSITPGTVLQLTCQLSAKCMPKEPLINSGRSSGAIPLGNLYMARRKLIAL